MSEDIINRRAIQWFPGHMAKTLRLMETEIRNVDCVLQILDARIPLSSLNPEIERITSGKPHLYIMNKADLADPDITAQWLAYFKSAGAGCLPMNSKQSGKAGAVKGPIEKELSALMERRRKKGMIGARIRVMVVGITNVGKSTLMNLLAKSEVFAENKLFATLDTTVRKVIIDNLPFLLSDTVGFIRKLPTDLVDSFKSTLDEVREADLLLHIVDISHPDFEEQIEVVNKTLADIGASGKPIILVFNKIDAYTYVEKAADDLTPRTKENLTLEELMKTWMAKMEDNCLFISAREKINLEELKSVVYARVKELHVQKYPYNDFLYQTYEEEEE